MQKRSRRFRHLMQLTAMLLTLVVDAVRFLRLCLRSPPALAAENLFLRKQLALYQERKLKPQRATDVTRITLVWLGRWSDWRQTWVVVQPKTFIHWHRRAFRLFWRWTSRPGRPTLPAELHALIRQIAREHPTWGQERIANELLLKLGLRVSPRTVRKYMPMRLDRGPGNRVQSQRWATCVRNHAQAIVACDFCVAVTATFRIFSVLVVIEHARRRVLHIHVTAYPTAEWTLQQLYEAIPSDHRDRSLIYDRERIFSQALDQSIRNLGLSVLQTPPRSPQAHAICERIFGPLRRECLDFMIPLTEHHVRRLLCEWVTDHEGRPHMSLGPGIPQPPAQLPAMLQDHRHRMAKSQRVAARPLPGDVHHEYRLEKKAA